MEKTIVELMDIQVAISNLLDEAIEEVAKGEVDKKWLEGYINGLDRAKEEVEDRIWSLENKLISE